VLRRYLGHEPEGVSPSLTAVAAAFCVSVDGNRPGQEGLLKTLTHELHPYVAYLILPFFAFTASGFSLAGVGWHTLGDPRLLGVMLGLFVGKQVGIYLAAALAIRLGWARLPEGASRLQLYGVCLLCGIGFTMSLFMTALAFPADDLSAQICVKSGVVLASLLSACAGAAILGRVSLRDEKA
jgi:NhaA family Na+:H+ antiporter